MLEIKHFVPLLLHPLQKFCCCCFSCRVFRQRESIEKLKNIQHVWTFLLYFFSTSPFSLYIFFNFIIHFSPVFRARMPLPMFFTLHVQINDCGWRFSFHHHSMSSALHSFPISHPFEALLIIKHFFLSSSELQKIAEKKTFLCRFKPFFSQPFLSIYIQFDFFCC